MLQFTFFFNKFYTILTFISIITEAFNVTLALESFGIPEVQLFGLDQSISPPALLNVDTFSLVNMVDDEFLGKVRGGMKLIGQTSGAEAIVRGLQTEGDKYGNRFISDSFGHLKLVMSIPDPKFKKAPKFETGVKTFRLQGKNS